MRQALHELHRRSDLLREKIQHLRDNIRPVGIKLAIDVGDDRHLRRLQVQALQAFRRSGSLAGATIEVWKAWLTGNGTTL